MTLAFCLFYYFPYGGLQRDFLRIARECLSRGHDIDVYTMQWDGPIEPGLTIHRMQTTSWQNHTKRVSYFNQIKSLVTHDRYDVIVGFNKMPGLDLYYAADTCYQSKARRTHSVVHRFTSRYKRSVAYEQAVFDPSVKTQILMLSAQQQAEYQACYATPAHRFHVLPPNIAHDRIAPDNAAEIRSAFRATLKLKDDELVLLAVGSGFKTKGLDRTINALAALPAELKHKCRLIVIGEDKSHAFEQQAKRLGVQDKVFFLGGRDDIPHFLLSADLLVHPAYNENTGTVLLEAVASGLPVLVTDVCGYAHHIDKANAGTVLSSPFNQLEFNKVLAAMLLSPLQLNWKQNAIQYAKTTDIYSLPIKAADLIEAFNLRDSLV